MKRDRRDHEDERRPAGAGNFSPIPASADRAARSSGFIAAALFITGCGTPTTAFARASATPTPTFISVRQPFSLFTHCGILTTSFAGRAFYVETLDPSHVAVLGDPLGNPFAPGWMTLVSPHVAEFTDLAGHRIRFVDYLPGEVDQPYPLTVLVISGGNQLGDVQSPAAGGARLTRCLGSVDRRTATGGMPTPRFMER